MKVKFHMMDGSAPVLEVKKEILEMSPGIEWFTFTGQTLGGDYVQTILIRADKVVSIEYPV